MLGFRDDCMKNGKVHECNNKQMIKWTINQAWMYRAVGSGNYYNVGRSKGKPKVICFPRPSNHHTCSAVCCSARLLQPTKIESCRT